jgi:hypothetical protein
MHTHILRRRDSLVSALGWLDRRKGLGDGVRNGVEGSGRSLSNGAFDLGEDLLDRIEVGRVFGKKQEASAGSLNGFAHGFSFMGAKIVEDDNVVGFESRDEELLDISAKALAVDRPVEQAGRLDAVVAKRGEEGRGLPLALRNLIDEAFPARCQP